MSTYARPFVMTGAALASAGALVVATPMIDGGPEPTPAFSAAPVSAAFHLLSKDDHYGAGHDDDDDYYYGVGYYDDDHYGDDHYGDDDDDDHHGWGGGIGNFVTDFLANNQDQVLAVTAMIPTFYLGPVALGNAVLANAYYTGYEGSAAGLDGVVAYVTSQFGVPPSDIVQGIVLGLTSLVPQFNIGPVAVGNSLLANAYFSGYNGSATGLPGLVSYVTSQLGLQEAPAAAAVSAPAAAAAVAVSAVESDTVAVPRAKVAAPAAAAVGTTVETPAAVAAADDAPSAAAETVRKADVGRPSGRGAAAVKSADAASPGKGRAARSASSRSGGSDS